MSTERLVLVTEGLDEPAMAWLRERCRVESIRSDAPAFDAHLCRAEALVVRTYTRVDEAMLDRAPKLKVIGRAGVGLDNIDLAACRSRGVQVVNTPDANTQAVVEFVFRLLLEHIRPVHFLSEPVSSQRSPPPDCNPEARTSDQWKQLRQTVVGRQQLDELTLGIFGLGRIGKRVATVAGAFGMRVIYHDIETVPVDERHGAQPVAAEELLAQADIVSVHIDGRPENRGVLDERMIRLMKPVVTFINTSRGFVVDHDALASFLRDHPEAVALLDVHDPEPIEPSHPLLGLPNAKLSPHLASRTKSAMARMSWVVTDVWNVLAGREPTCPADAAAH